MVIITCLYLIIVYLLFFRFKILPWNKISRVLCLVVGVVILSGFLVGLQSLTPSSSQAAITGRVTEIAPGVSGRVTRVAVEPSVLLDRDTILFELNPTIFQARVDDLESRLALARTRLGQYTELASVDAGTVFQVEQTQAEVDQLSAQLESARFDLANTVVRAPGPGMVPRLFLQPGMEVSPARSVLSFVHTDSLLIVGTFQQKSLPGIKLGDVARINFPALPGRVFESRVIALPRAIGNTQVLVSGQLPVLEGQRMTREWPVYMEIPEGFPEELRSVGMAATVYIHTENAGIVGAVAIILQWIGTSLDAIL
jgi:multidrug resistance efflux pump